MASQIYSRIIRHGPHGSTSFISSQSSYIHGGGSSTFQSNDETQSSSNAWARGKFGIQCFSVEHPFSFMHAYPLDYWIHEIPKDPRISPRGSDLRAFRLILDVAPQTFGVPKSRTPEESTLTHGDILDAKARTGGPQAFQPPNGRSKQVPGVTRDKEEMTRGPYSEWYMSCFNGHTGSFKCMNLGDMLHVKRGSMLPRVTSTFHITPNW